MNERALVITGMGIVSSLGLSKDDYWNKILNNEGGIDWVEGFDTGSYAAKKGGEIRGFEAEKLIKRRYIKPLDRITRYSIVSIDQALHDAGLHEDAVNKQNIGIVIGSMYHGIGSIFKFKQECDENELLGLSPLYFPGIVFNSPAGQAAIEFKIEGPNSTINTGASSGLFAVLKGIEYVLSGKAEIMIAGGAEMFHEYIFAKYDRLGCLSCGGNGREKCMPFDRGRNGIILGEGACFFVLETCESAMKRNAHIYAQIAGYRSNYCDDGERNRVDALSRCIRNALIIDDRDMATEIDVVVSDGSGHKINDSIEAESIQTVFQKRSPIILSNKANAGHALGASGAFNLCVALLSISRGEIPPVKNLFDPEYSLNFARQRMKREVNNVLVNSIDFNGNNASLCITKNQ